MKRCLLLICLSALLASCSPKHAAVSLLADNVTSGDGVMVTDDDPELVREALPFGLKVYESLLVEVPEHDGLLEALAKGYTAYGYLLQHEADMIDDRDLLRARQLRARAALHYRRGRDFALRALDLRHPGFTETLRDDPDHALADTTEADLNALYWAGAAWAAAVSTAKDDMGLVGDLPLAGKLVARVLALDESYDDGRAHEFFIAYEGSRPNGSAAEARAHYQRALALSQGKRASVHLALAESVVLREQNLAEFKDLIAAALAVDPDREPSLRLVNTIARQRAEWLRARLPDLFFDYESEEPLS
jgi:TRAP transporter T-component